MGAKLLRHLSTSSKGRDACAEHDAQREVDHGIDRRHDIGLPNELAVESKVWFIRATSMDTRQLCPIAIPFGQNVGMAAWCS